MYGEPFKDEFHSRLKFSHRGIVAMVNEDTPNTNGSQFFITFGECSWIDKKNTIFGKVTGDSIYNLMQLKEMEVDANSRPLNPPRILKITVVMNPFDDIVTRSDAEIKKARSALIGDKPSQAAVQQQDGDSSSDDE